MTRSTGVFMRFVAGSSTVVTIATPPIHSTTPSMCSTRAIMAPSMPALFSYRGSYTGYNTGQTHAANTVRDSHLTNPDTGLRTLDPSATDALPCCHAFGHGTRSLSKRAVTKCNQACAVALAGRRPLDAAGI